MLGTAIGQTTIKSTLVSRTCDELKVRFTIEGVSSGYSYVWDFGKIEGIDGTKVVSTTTIDTTIIYNTHRIYDVVLTSTRNIDETVSVDSIEVIFEPFAYFRYHYTESNGSGTSALLTAYENKTETVDYSWRLGGIEVGPNAPEFDLTFNTDTVVTLVVKDQNGCIDVFRAPLRALNKDSLQIPNVFSPNNDGEHDLFYVLTDGLSEYRFQVYSRGGILVYRSKSTAIAWDGRTNSGQNAATGTYVYLIDDLKNNKTYKGFLYLFR